MATQAERFRRAGRSAWRVGIVGVLLTTTLAAAEPEYTRFTSYFDQFQYDEAQLLQHDYVSLLSETAAFSLHRTPREAAMVLLDASMTAQERAERGKRNSVREPIIPTVLYARTRAGVRMFEPGARIDGADLASPWLLLSAAGDRNLPFDSPTLIVLSRRPKQVEFASRERLIARYDGPDSGWVARMSLYGYFKPRQEHAPDYFAEHNVPQYGPKTWTWKAGLPEDVVQRCEYWTRVSRALPIRARESFSVDRARGEVTTRVDYDWLLVSDDWGTRPLKLAPIQPILGFTMAYPGFPIQFRPAEKIKDPDYMTSFGPFIGFEDVDRVEYVIPAGKYVDHVLELDRAKLSGAIDRQALANIEKTMAGKFRSPNRWSFDHQGVNFVWAGHSDYWYAAALPLVGAELAQTAKQSWQMYMRHFFLDEQRAGVGWMWHRDRLILNGPGSGAWGGFDDRGKLGSTMLITVWAYGHFTGDWDLLRQRWDFVKRIYNTDLECDHWHQYSRRSHAEWGDIGPPSIALARMAWQVGDYDTYLYATFLAGRQLVGHWAVWHAGDYFRRRGPHASDQKMPEMVLLSNYDLWNGCWINGRGFVPKTLPPEEQWQNVIVRFALSDLGRFYKDWLDKRLRQFLEHPDFQAARGGSRQTKESHIGPSLLRIWGLCTTAPQEQVAQKGPWQNWSGSSGQLGGNYALLLANASAHKLVRVVPPGEPTEFIAAQDRQFAGKHWQGNGSDRWVGLGRIGWPPNHFGGRNIMFQLGRTGPDWPAEAVPYTGDQIVDATVVARWADRAPKTSQPGPAGQFDAEWLVLGPFDNHRDNAIATVFPPEKKLDLDAVYTAADGVLPAHDQPIRWQSARARNGVIDDEAFFGVRGVAAAYHLQHVYSPTDRPALLILGHHNASRAWVNGQEVFYRHYHHDPYSETPVAVTLKKGWNTLLIKSISRRDGWKTGGRIVAPDGQPFSDLKYSARPQ